MRVIALSRLGRFWRRHPAAEGALRAWYAEACRAAWRSPQDIRNMHRSADFLAGDRVVFNIGGNNYRLVVHVKYEAFVIYIRFVGTHAEYDRVDAEKV